MNEEYFIYQKFTDIDIAGEVADELKANGIKAVIQTNNKSSIGNFEATTIDFDSAIYLKSNDFELADNALENYYSKLIGNVGQDYYLHHFSKEELYEIIRKPYEWGHFDLQLAKKLLGDIGEEISNEKIQQNKLTQINEVAILEKVGKAKIISGYVFSILFPLIGFIIGFGILNNKRTLPNGKVFFMHDRSDRNHGNQILLISIVWFILLITHQFLSKIE